MDLQAVVWVAISVGGPAVAAWTWPRLRKRLAPGAIALLPLAPWVHAIGPSYLAILTGAVLGRDFGLYGAGPARIAAGLLASAGGIAAAALARRWLHPPSINPITVLLEEPRWALYRAAGLLWLPGPLAGVVLGVGLAVMESGLKGQWWRARDRARPEAWFPVLRACLSAVVFMATQSFWLTAGVQAGILAIRPLEGKPKGPKGGERAA